MWNAFPFHPYKERNEESNRAPLAKEVKVGKLFIELLNRFFDIGDENGMPGKDYEHKKKTHLSGLNC